VVAWDAPTPFGSRGSVPTWLSWIATSVYMAIKAAIVRYTRSLAVELGPDGIRVNRRSRAGVVERRWGR
jgi:NAD(P)-dependent dehydrogenase (short-subunit alcohol dehydrogenase family)